MEMRAPSGLQILSYLLYALVLICILLYVRFPSDKFEKYTERKIEEAFSGTDVNVGTFKLQFPFSISIDKALISQAVSGDEILYLENIRIKPIMSGFGLDFMLSGDLYGGNFSTELLLAPRDGRFTLNDLELSAVDISQSEYLRIVTRREISGNFDFIGSYSGAISGGDHKDLQGVMAVSDGKFSLMQPVLSLKVMEVNSLEAGLAFKEGSLKLIEGMFKGKEIDAEFEGSVKISDNVSLSNLSVSGSMVPQKVFLKEKPQVLRVVKRLQKQYRKTALPFNISGTIGNPRFRFGTL